MILKAVISPVLTVILASVSPQDSRAAKSTTPLDAILVQVERKYSEASSLQAEVKKNLTLSVLKKNKNYEGSLVMRKGGDLRLEFLHPTRSLILMNQKGIWSIQYPEDPEFDDTVRVIKTARPKASDPQMILAFVLAQGKILQHFKAKKTGMNGDFVTFRLYPKQKTSEMEKVKVVVDSKNLVITELAYWDSLNNETNLKFSSIEFGVELKNDLFRYTAPPNAEETEM